MAKKENIRISKEYQHDRFEWLFILIKLLIAPVDTFSFKGVFNTQHHGRDFPKGSDLGEWVNLFPAVDKNGQPFKHYFIYTFMRNIIDPLYIFIWLSSIQKELGRQHHLM